MAYNKTLSSIRFWSEPDWVRAVKVTMTDGTVSPVFLADHDTDIDVSTASIFAFDDVKSVRGVSACDTGKKRGHIVNLKFYDRDGVVTN